MRSLFCFRWSHKISHEQNDKAGGEESQVGIPTEEDGWNSIGVRKLTTVEMSNDCIGKKPTQNDQSKNQ